MVDPFRKINPPPICTIPEVKFILPLIRIVPVGMAILPGELITMLLRLRVPVVITDLVPEPSIFTVPVEGIKTPLFSQLPQISKPKEPDMVRLAAGMALSVAVEACAPETVRFAQAAPEAVIAG